MTTTTAMKAPLREVVEVIREAYPDELSEAMLKEAGVRVDIMGETCA